MKQILSLNYAKISLIVGLAGLGLLVQPTASAATLDSLDLPSVEKLTKKVTEEAEKAAAVAATKAAEEAATKAAAEEAAKATNMVSEVAVEYTANTYPFGQCTWGAKEAATWVGNNWGNANDWAATAVSLGYEVGTTPKVGAVMVWSDGGYGHVAVVTDVSETGEIQVVESNYAGSTVLANYRGWFNPVSDGSVISYIYAPAGV